MKKSVLQGWLVAVAVVTSVPRVDAWLFETQIVPIPPAMLVVALLVAANAIDVVASANVATKNIVRSFTLFLLLALISVSYIAWMAFDPILVERDQYLLPLLSLSMVGLYGSAFGTITASSAIAWMRHAARVALLVSVAGILLDLVRPDFFQNPSARPGGFAVNPNGAAVTVLAALVVSLDFGSELRKGYLWLLIAGAGILITLSRSGILVYAAILLVFLYSGGVSWRRMLVSSLLIGSLSIAGYFIYVLMTSALGQFDAGALVERINPFLAEEQFANDDSRVHVARYYWGLVLEAPVFGHGLGTSYYQALRAHNTFLNIYVEAGAIAAFSWLGVVGWLLYRFKITSDGFFLAAAIVAGLMTIFNNNLVVNRACIFMLAFAVVVVASARDSGRRMKEMGP